ncbi:Biotin/lipoyl attachment [Lasiodiplodia theobromae]|uniref:Acetyltransferase component of pyruvate dehydrogenase complex n=2 Tax=Lasiodiplodia TaxID=66739 RepID=A0A5N5D9S6_9PEZI|nr:Biotin/lipoyl attachment domain-containing protein [Lasiodiplodia theobromae]KAB2574391.1 Dihydrolipoyllysine-residue acetyltransferase component of pyruvate dehydrogenase complex [Lasiodiplodia theobromae]KAF4539336.1 Biotin/lipoyl attachment domain-containing protein [Lasiodiplodia theobromae]KAF9638364.1 Biotin/lipoyl attachment [Lasiodiplodia theobromae]KAK0622112.1 Dihydrolipoyllysine-residue acetyltransferase component of pyruvate dehydrogenase complex [Lasiodiplodia hormozganensis]
MSAAAVLSRSSGQSCLRAAAGLRALPRSQLFSARSAPAISALARYYASKSFPPHTVVSMPALSPTMTAGNIGAWQKKPGDAIAPGEVLVEIETDKAQMDFEFQEEGTLAKVLRDTGSKDVPVGSPIAVMVEEGADVSAFADFTAEDAGGDKGAAAPAKEESKPAAPAPSEAPKQAAPAAQESESTGARLQPVLEREPIVSPAAKKLALEKGVPISQVKGTGPAGRITLADVEKFQAAAPAGAPAASFEDTPASGMRKVIATRMAESLRENAHYFVSSSISVSKLLKLRAALNASADGAYRLSVNDFIIKACSVALKKVPTVNSSWIEENGQAVVRQHNNVDISVAVATPTGLITPIVRNVTGLGLQSISAQVKDLGKRAKENKLKPEEYQGGTFTVSNMGMNDAVERFTSIINSPQAAIVAIGTTKKVAIPAETEEGTGIEWDDQIVITGSFDHRVVDGAVGGEYMKALKKVIENPLELLL